MIDFTWSYSRLTSFETCGKRYYHYNVVRDIKEPQSQQLRDGNRLHAAFDQRVKGEAELPSDMTQYEPMLSKIIGSPGDTLSEQKLALTAEFLPVGYFGKGVWFRTVIDAAKINAALATVFDWKTGKPSHDTTQLQLMSATILHHLPRIDEVRSVLMFLNHNQVEREDFRRDDLTGIWAEILPRVNALEKAHKDQEFPPRPSGLCKKYCAVVSCPYHGVGG